MWWWGGVVAWWTLTDLCHGDPRLEDTGGLPVRTLPTGLSDRQGRPTCKRLDEHLQDDVPAQRIHDADAGGLPTGADCSGAR